MDNFSKLVLPGYLPLGLNGRHYPAHFNISYLDGKFSISGVIGALPSGNARGSCGQCIEDLLDPHLRLAAGWTKEMVEKFVEVWRRWHLNDMRAECEHQRELGWVEKAREEVTTMKYGHKETKRLGWLYEKDHPEGLLCKPCPVCGYKYGSAWLKEEVPEDVLKWVLSLPRAEKKCAWNSHNV